MARKFDSYSPRDFEGKFKHHKQQLSFLARPVQHPKAFLLGGQSGAGKTRLHKICGEHLKGNVIVINGDEFRKSHPQFAEIQEHYGVDAPAHTAAWAGTMTEALIDVFSAQGYNLVIEGTLRTSEVPLATARLLRERGYGVLLALMAVKPEISLVSCQIRYEMMRIARTTPRATDPKHHDKIVYDIAENLGVLEESGLFDDVLIYNRAETRLFPAEGDADSGTGASEVLREALFGPWSAEEEAHYAHLQIQLEGLREQSSN